MTQYIPQVEVDWARDRAATYDAVGLLTLRKTCHRLLSRSLPLVDCDGFLLLVGAFEVLL